MSRSAEWRRQQYLLSGKAKQAPEVEEVAERPNMVPMECNSQYNINPLLLENIKSNKYFRSLHSLNTFNEVVDEIYNQVDSAVPWIRGSARSPTAFFCLLYKLLLMKVTRKQMQTLLKHKDSPFIRAAGFMYLRYTCPPDQLYNWFEKYINDCEEFVPDSNAPNNVTTIGAWLESIIQDQKYYATVLPRIPQNVQRSMLVNILRKREDLKRSQMNEPRRKQLVLGTIVQAKYHEDGKWYSGRIDKVCDNGNFVVTFLPEDEYGNQEEVTIGELDLSKLQDEEEFIGRIDTSDVCKERSMTRSTSRHRSSRSTSRQRSSRSTSRHRSSRSTSRRRSSRSTSRQRSNRSTSRQRSNRATSRHRSNSRDSKRYRRPNRSLDRRFRGNSRRSQEESQTQHRSWNRSRHRSRDRRRTGHQSSSKRGARSRSRRSYSEREAACGPIELTDEQLLEQVKRQESEKHATSGRNFTTGRVASLKGSLAVRDASIAAKDQPDTVQQRSKPSLAASEVARKLAEHASNSAHVDFDPEVLAKRQAEMELIKAKYGDASSKSRKT